MKRTRVSQWPSLNVNVNPATLERIEETAERRALPVSAVVREALDRAFGEPLASNPLGEGRALASV